MANKLYEESSIQAIADAIRLKSDASIDTYTIGQMADGCLSLPMANLPSYHVKEAKRVVQKIAELKAQYPNNIVFGTISDNHVDMTTPSTMTSARHAIYALESVGAMCCDFVVNLGDNVAGTNIDNDIDYENAVYMEAISRYAIADLVSFNLVGNHCKSNSTQKIYDLIGKYNEFDNCGKTKIRGYGYKDFSDKKVRVICLNTTDYWNAQGGNGMSYEQKDFFMKALDLSAKEDYSKWTIIVLSHIPLDFIGGDYNKSNDLKAILKAYNDGSTATITINSSYAKAENESYSGTLIYNYLGKNAPKIINIHGHVHTNVYGKMKFIDDDTKFDIVRISTGNSAFLQNKSNSYEENGEYGISAEEANKIKKVVDSAKDTSATFYFVDLDRQIVYSIGYGADIDRLIPYTDATVYTVTYELGDAIIDDSSTTVIEGEAFVRKLTVPTDYEITSVIVTMGGADITSTVYSNGTITVSEVTGDINIIVVTKDNYVPVWDIANRTAVTDMYKGANDVKEISRHHYYWGAASTGAIFYNKIISCTVNGNNLTFTASEKNLGIGVPYHLEPSVSYTFSATSSVKGRIRYCLLNADGTASSENGVYGSSGTSHSLTFTAPTDETQWVMLIFDAYTANEEVTYSNIELVRN